LEAATIYGWWSADRDIQDPTAVSGRMSAHATLYYQSVLSWAVFKVS
jgi:hypothetical protein